MKCLLVRMGGSQKYTGNYLDIDWVDGLALVTSTEYSRISSLFRVAVIKDIDVSVEQLLALGDGASSAKSDSKKLQGEVKTLKGDLKTLRAENKELLSEVAKYKDASNVSSELSTGVVGDVKPVSPVRKKRQKK